MTPLAIFGASGTLNLVLSLVVFALVVVWLALIVWTYLDARRRISDQVLVLCATAASLFPFIGTFIYTILRPPEFIEDAKERELEIKAAELRVRQLSEQSCPNCNFPIEKSYLRCPNCQRRLKDPCQSCGKPVDPRWALCPYCETALPGRSSGRRSGSGSGKSRPSKRDPQRSGESRKPPRQGSSKQRERQPSSRRPKREGSGGGSSSGDGSGSGSGSSSSGGGTATREAGSSSRSAGDERSKS